MTCRPCEYSDRVSRSVVRTSKRVASPFPPPPSQPVDIRRGVWMGGLRHLLHASISRHPCTAASKGRDAPAVAHLHALHREAALTAKSRRVHEKGTMKRARNSQQREKSCVPFF